MFVVLKDQDWIVFIYEDNLNGVVEDIVGVLLENCCVLGMMFYLECVVDFVYGLIDGQVFFCGLID